MSHGHPSPPQQQQQQSDCCPELFVGNVSVQADVAYLQRLFSAYGHVRDVQLMDENEYAIVTFQSVDDADCAIAALHLRYCMAPKVPILVMYHKDSPKVSEYGREVSDEYRMAASEDRYPRPLPLTRFDPLVERGTVQLPPSEIAPPVPMAWRYGVMPGATQNSGFTTGLFP